jgi:lycopene cyclase domain-containing protein
MALVSVGGVVGLELLVLRTGLLATRAYRWSVAICLAFMILVDGWLTKLSAPIISYDPTEFSELRFPFDIPAEDFLLAFSLLTLAMLLWDLAGRRLSPGHA